MQPVSPLIQGAGRTREPPTPKQRCSFDASGLPVAIKTRAAPKRMRPNRGRSYAANCIPFPNRCDVTLVTPLGGLPEKRGKNEGFAGPSWPVGTGAEITRRRAQPAPAQFDLSRHAASAPYPKSHPFSSFVVGRTGPRPTRSAGLRRAGCGPRTRRDKS